MNPAIVFIATDWGYKHGGINSVNRDLCSAVALALGKSYQVVCVALRGDQAAIVDAQDAGVRLLPLLDAASDARFEPHRATEIISKVEKEVGTDVSWWIGHDVITGEVALACKAALGYGMTAIVHHMNYDAYISYKIGNSSKSRAKVNSQLKLLNSADVVIAIGPKLLDSALDKTRNNHIVRVVELTPGLANTTGLALPHRFSAVTFGRLDGNDEIKQARLATAAFGAAVGLPGDPLGSDPTLTVIGLSSDHNDTEHRELASLAEDHASRAVHVHGWPYIEDRRELLKHLQSHSACMMLSLHEGFGLTGWEAIAAEVPLILTENSGVHRMIDNLLGGAGLGCTTPLAIRGTANTGTFNPRDLVDARDALVWVRKRGEKAKSDARKLKQMLSETCTWKNAARAFLLALEIDLPQPPNLRKDQSPPTNVKVVFIDDDRYFAEQSITHLKSYYSVNYCDTLEVGASKICRNPDLRVIVLDIMMRPPRNVSRESTDRGFDTGLWFLRSISAFISAKRIPVVLHTNRDLTIVHRQIQSLVLPDGLIKVCHKQYSTQDHLLATIDQLCQQWQAAEDSSTLRLDPSTLPFELDSDAGAWEHAE
jgi:glycosyltransferase involved in cell wall biosynthesis